jgi:hypothetical protein
MTNKPDPTNPNAAHFAKPYFLPRPAMREQSLSQRIRTSQARLATVKPAKITLPELPESLREK